MTFHFFVSLSSWLFPFLVLYHLWHFGNYPVRPEPDGFRLFSWLIIEHPHTPTPPPPPPSFVSCSRWCTGASPEPLNCFPCLDKMPLKPAGAAGKSITCHDRSARISDCIILAWWSCSERTAEGAAHQSLWQQCCPLGASDEQWIVEKGHKEKGEVIRGTREGYSAVISFSHFLWPGRKQRSLSSVCKI